ncbi:peptidoglycan-binding domain-containing protein [Microbacterium sp. PMB16]|uniref:peptidoglycan-binding domain-containing protein n=1 Tax=Microbacterium sp. PMB16 TaxID=3120157 RepID=UPI003F4B45F7
MSVLKKAAATIIMAAALVAGSIALAAPASAAEVKPAAIVKAADCNGSRAFALTTNANESARVPTYGGSKSCTLRSGNRSGAVSTLQNSLNSCHGKSITVDGDFGPATRTALIQVQASLGLTADGIYGPNTLSNMRHKNSINLACSPGYQISNTPF